MSDVVSLTLTFYYRLKNDWHHHVTKDIQVWEFYEVFK